MANDKAFKVKNGLQAGRYLSSSGASVFSDNSFDVANLEYTGKLFSVAAQDTNAKGLTLSSDGQYMYVGGISGNDLNQYTLSTPWDITTASFTRNVSFSSVIYWVEGVTFKPDGTKMYLTGLNGVTFNDYKTAEYSLSTAWDISTASLSYTLDSDLYDNQPKSITFKPDGTKAFIVGFDSDLIIEYNLSTAWSLSSASFVQSLDVTTQNTGPYSVAFNSAGTIMVISKSNSGASAVYKYNLSTAWDVSTASYASISFDLSASDVTYLHEMFVDAGGFKAYFMDNTDNTVYQYTLGSLNETLDLSTGTYFSFTPSGATTVSFTNPPASGLAVAFAVEINGDGSAITWPSSVKWHEATAPTATASKEIYTFITTDGGTTYYGKKAAGDLA